MVWGQNSNMSNQQNYGMGMGNMGMGNLTAAALGPGGRGILGESPGMGGFAGMQGLGGVGQNILGGTGGSDSLDSMIQQRRLQEQLSLRESQLALASNLLQKQSQLMMDVGLPGSGGGGASQANMVPMMSSPPNIGRPMIPSLLDMPAQMRHGKRPVPPNMDLEYKRRRRDSSPSDSRGHDYDQMYDRDHYSPNRRREDPPSHRDRPSRFSRRDSGEGWRGRRNSEEYDPADPTGDEENFRGHMSSSRHRDRIEDIANIHERKSTQIEARIKAQEHLKRIEKTRIGFCKLCDQDLAMPFMRHKLTTLHKKREMQVHKGCGWCGVTSFQNFSEVLKHRERESHKINASKYGKRSGEETREKERNLRPTTETKSNRSKGLVTIDSVGFEKNKKKRMRTSASSRTNSKTSAKEVDPMPELKYNAGVAVGPNYVVPVSGFFCKLCHKFYSTETAAKVTHCQSQQHFTIFKKAKIAAKAKAKAQKSKPTSTSTPISDKTNKAKDGEEEADNTMDELRRKEENMEDKQEEEEVLGQNLAAAEKEDEGEKGKSGEKGQTDGEDAEVVKDKEEGSGDVNGEAEKGESNMEVDNNLEEEEEEKLLEKDGNESDGLVPEDGIFEDEDGDGEMGIVDLIDGADGTAETDDKEDSAEGEKKDSADVEDSANGEEDSVKASDLKDDSVVVLDVKEDTTPAVEVDEAEVVDAEDVGKSPQSTPGRGRGRARRGKAKGKK